jgi:hypothetical protein
MQKPTFQKSTIRVELLRTELLNLLNAVAMRAYKLGHSDGVNGLPANTEKVRVSKRSVDDIK